MSNVWLVLPSKRPPEEAEECLSQWRNMGYRIAIQRDPADGYHGESPHVVIYREYAGYAEAVNFLVRDTLARDPECAWCVAAGDDMLPDPHKGPDEIARECADHFAAAYHPSFPLPRNVYETFGVMQPTGDDFGTNPNYPDPKLRGPYCTRVAGSPWMGREFCRRINQGRGPLWPEYFHCGEDEELQAVAIKYGVFWQRPDLTHYHRHALRPRPGERLAPNSRLPDFLKRAYSQEEWAKYKQIFAERQSLGFPGSEPLP